MAGQLLYQHGNLSDIGGVALTIRGLCTTKVSFDELNKMHPVSIRAALRLEFSGEYSSLDQLSDDQLEAVPVLFWAKWWNRHADQSGYIISRLPVRVQKQLMTSALSFVQAVKPTVFFALSGLSPQVFIELCQQDARFLTLWGEGRGIVPNDQRRNLIPSDWDQIKALLVIAKQSANNDVYAEIIDEAYYHHNKKTEVRALFNATGTDDDIFYAWMSFVRRIDDEGFDQLNCSERNFAGHWPWELLLAERRGQGKEHSERLISEQGEMVGEYIRSAWAYPQLSDLIGRRLVFPYLLQHPEAPYHSSMTLHAWMAAVARGSDCASFTASEKGRKLVYKTFILPGDLLGEDNLIPTDRCHAQVCRLLERDKSYTELAQALEELLQSEDHRKIAEAWIISLADQLSLPALFDLWRGFGDEESEGARLLLDTDKMREVLGTLFANIGFEVTFDETGGVKGYAYGLHTDDDAAYQLWQQAGIDSDQGLFFSRVWITSSVDLFQVLVGRMIYLLGTDETDEDRSVEHFCGVVSRLDAHMSLVKVASIASGIGLSFADWHVDSLVELVEECYRDVKWMSWGGLIAQAYLREQEQPLRDELYPLRLIAESGFFDAQREASIDLSPYAALVFQWLTVDELMKLDYGLLREHKNRLADEQKSGLTIALQGHDDKVKALGIAQACGLKIEGLVEAARQQISRTPEVSPVDEGGFGDDIADLLHLNTMEAINGLQAHFGPEGEEWSKRIDWTALMRAVGFTSRDCDYRAEAGAFYARHDITSEAKLVHYFGISDS